jgi:hypothetical protein
LRLVTAMFGAAALIASTPALAAWEEHSFRELGFLAEFPNPPVKSTGTYKTMLVPSAPVQVFSQKLDNTLFIAAVADMQDRAGDGASLLIEAEFNLALIGDIKGNSTSRVEPGRDAVFGRFITIECRKGRPPGQPGQDVAAQEWFKGLTGTDCPDGARLTVNMFFHRGRFYLLNGMNLPTPNGASGPGALRFANSISFYRPDGTRNPADGAQ